LSFVGYIAQRIFGARHGYPVAGLLGGIVSSTNVTLTFARLSRRETALARPLAIGTIGACTMLFPRVLIATLVLNPLVARALVPYLVAPFAVGLLALAIEWRTSPAADTPSLPANPLQIGPALQMALIFQFVPPIVYFATGVLGVGGLIASGALLGLTDVDALTITMARGPASITATMAAEVIAVGILANCVLKTSLAFALGARQFRVAGSTVITAMAVSIAIAIGAMH
jgi:uncharacterized membrane protein (DUF4010 family)